MVGYFREVPGGTAGEGRLDKQLVQLELGMNCRNGKESEKGRKNGCFDNERLADFADESRLPPHPGLLPRGEGGNIASGHVSLAAVLPRIHSGPAGQLFFFNLMGWSFTGFTFEGAKKISEVYRS